MPRELAPDEQVFDEAGNPVEGMSWLKAASMAGENFLPSLKQLGMDTIQPIISPIETAKSIYELGKGLIQLGIPGEQGSEDSARAVGAFFANRYGGLENIKQTLATDPAGLLADLATIASGGGAVAARSSGWVGRAGRIASSVGEAIDPISGTVKAAKVATGIPASIIGNTTGAGSQALSEAYRAGQVGGDVGRIFRENITGNVDRAAVVSEMDQALKVMRDQRSNAYKAGMVDIANDATVLDFNPILEDIAKAESVGRFKGKVLDRSAAKTWDDILSIVAEWGDADPSVFHTPDGLDKLKQAIGDVRDNTEQGTRSRVVADQAYNAVKKQIEAQAPVYADIMKNYEMASRELKDIQKTMSASDKATTDTKLRKLQSIMRNDANTNYGQRVNIGQRLDDVSGGKIMPALAGQQLQDMSPRGLAKLGSIATGGAALGTGSLLPLAALPFQSPRLMGEAAYAAGFASRPAAAVVNKYMASPFGRVPQRAIGLGSFQTGRASDEERMKNALRITIDRDARQ